MNNTTYKSVIEPLTRAGIKEPDAMKLRGVSRQLHEWHELLCGNERGAIERDEKTGELRWYDNELRTWGRYYGRDTETLALKRLAKIMSSYPTLTAYVQTDPRGASLYILRPGDVPEGKDADSYYNNGIAVYK